MKDNKNYDFNKLFLTINEAAAYFGIGKNRLRQFISLHEDENFVAMFGIKHMINKDLFYSYLSENKIAM